MQENKQLSNRRVYIMMVFSSLLTSGAYIAGKLAVLQFPPLALTFYRFLFALPLIFVVLYIYQPDNWLPKKHEMPYIVLLGAIGIFVYHALFFSALKHTTAINSSLVAAINPILVALLSFFVLGDQIPWPRALGIILSFAGVLLTITNGNWKLLINMNLNFGDIIMFLAVCIWAVYSVFNRKVMIQFEITPLKLTAYCFLVGVIISFPFYLAQKPSTYLIHTTASGWLSVCYLAVCSSVLAYLFYNIAIRKVGAARAAVFANLVPVFTIIQSIIFLRESFGWFKFLSTVLIISGVFLTTRSLPPKFLVPAHVRKAA